MTNAEMKVLEIGHRRYGLDATLKNIISYQNEPYQPLNCGNESVNRFREEEWNRLNKAIAKYNKENKATKPKGGGKTAQYKK